MASKPKFGFKGLTSVTARTTQKMKERVGKSEETVDVGFNQEHAKFDLYYKQLKKLSKDLTDYVKTLRHISDAHSAMGSNTAVFYDSGSALYGASQRYLGTVGDIDRARQALDETLRVDIAAPVDAYLGQYKTVENRINERSRRRLEMDRFRHKVKRYQVHPPEKPEKMDRAQANYNMWKAAYEELNKELTVDIQRLCADRNNFFDPCFSTLIQATARYYQEVAAISTSLVTMVQHIDGKAAHRTTTVITDNDCSVAMKTYEEHKKPGQAVHTPSYQQPPSYAQQGYGAPSGYDAAQSSYGAYGSPQQQQPYRAPSPPAAGSYGLAPPQQHSPSPYGAPAGNGFGAPRGALPQAPVPGRPPVPVARPAGEQARALYAFAPEASTELGFAPGQVLTIVSKNGEWWEAELNGRRGLIPANYVQLL